MTDTDATKLRLDRGGLFAKLAEVMAEVGPIAATGKNHLGSSYIEEGAALDALRPLLAARNIVVLPSMGKITREETKTSGGKNTALTTAEIAFTFCDGDSGETWTCDWAGVGDDMGDKGLIKAETSAERTFLLKAFMVSSSDAHPTTQQGPRADGQAPITQEQFDGISEAYGAAGQPRDVLHAELDKYRIPREQDGKVLDEGQRVAMLASLDAIKVHKALVAAAPKEGPNR